MLTIKVHVCAVGDTVFSSKVQITAVPPLILLIHIFDFQSIVVKGILAEKIHVNHSEKKKDETNYNANYINTKMLDQMHKVSEIQIEKYNQ